MKAKIFLFSFLVLTQIAFPVFAQENKESPKVSDTSSISTKSEADKNDKTNIKAIVEGVKREKQSASKIGDKYMGQVAHF